MAICDLPNMYALSPRACGPWASGIHIRQIPHGLVTTISYMYCIINKDLILLLDKDFGT